MTAPVEEFIVGIVAAVYEEIEYVPPEGLGVLFTDAVHPPTTDDVLHVGAGEIVPGNAFIAPAPSAIDTTPVALVVDAPPENTYLVIPSNPATTSIIATCVGSTA